MRRDYLVWRSYRFHAVGQFLGAVGLLIVTYYVGRALAGVNTNYIAYFLVGVTFTDLLIVCLRSTQVSLREAQIMGTFETMLMTPLPVWQFMAGCGAYRLVSSWARTAVIILGATTVFGYWHGANVFSSLMILVPAVAVFVSMGLIAGAASIVFKQADHLIAGYVGLSFVCSGTVFPVVLLPGWIQGLTGLLPMAHVLKGIRLALDGAQPGVVASEAIVLAMVAAVLLPLSMLLIHAS
ncbi:MAG: ABC transporter permease, partial [Actinobacteria bacterium]|nr:ABC transporter permease [Actinomycetota bacterium]